MNILISSGGRRVGLAKSFRESQEELGVRGRLIGIDATPYSSIAHFTDAFHTVPPCTDAKFIPALKQICEREQVDLLVPTIDSELSVYAAVKEEFEACGTRIAVSAPETIEIARDKRRTHAWLSAQGFPVPRQATPEQVLAHSSEWKLPLILKPAGGSASVGLHVLDSFDALAATAKAQDNCVVQELIGGREHTVNVFVNSRGQCICAVPHLRMEVRGGEVSKAVTVKHRELMGRVTTLVEALPGAYGALNVQCFVTAAEELRFIEINARFGGGYPLTHRAGAKITSWLLEDLAGSGPQAACEEWQEGLLMLRYDEAVYRSHSDNVDSGLPSALPSSAPYKT